MNIRRLEENDYELGFLNILTELTTVGTISKEEWLNQFKIVSSNSSIEIWVIHNTLLNKILGSATLFIEPKFIHNCSNVGHIEDVVLSKSTQGTGLGKKIVTFLVERAKLRGCYKVILDCNQETIGFYQKCGFRVKDTQMALYYS
jgi:glucosamine-phosphate N-acetyltransferase